MQTVMKMANIVERLNRLVDKYTSNTNYIWWGDEQLKMNKEIYNSTEKGGFMQILMANIVER